MFIWIQLIFSKENAASNLTGAREKKGRSNLPSWPGKILGREATDSTQMNLAFVFCYRGRKRSHYYQHHCLLYSSGSQLTNVAPDKGSGIAPNRTHFLDNFSIHKKVRVAAYNKYSKAISSLFFFWYQTDRPSELDEEMETALSFVVHLVNCFASNTSFSRVDERCDLEKNLAKRKRKEEALCRFYLPCPQCSSLSNFYLPKPGFTW